MAVLDPSALQGIRHRLVIPYDPSVSDEEVLALFNSTGAIDDLIAAGAEVVVLHPSGLPDSDWAQMLACGLRDGIDSYMADNQLDPASLADIIALNNSNADPYMPLGQARLEEAEDCALSTAEESELTTDATTVTQAYIDDPLVSNHVDALVALDDSWSLQYGLAGYPAITVPRGLIGDWRGGLTFIGTSCTDAKLIGFAYAFEQTGPQRVVPNLVVTSEDGTPVSDA